MTSLLSGLMKISGKLPLASTADAMLPSPGHRRQQSGGVAWENRGEGAQKKGWAGARERTRNFTRISETNFSGALRSRQAGVVNF